MVASSPPRPRRAYARHDPRQAWARLALGVGSGAATVWLTPATWSWTLRAVVGWDAGATILMGLTWWIIVRNDVDRTRHRASAEDPGRTAVWLIVLASSLFSLFAGAVALREVRALSPERRGCFGLLCLLAVGLAWAVTQTSFGMRYAHLYYRDDDDGEGGLEFPGGQPPDYLDFAYFAFTAGMCFQVSDVTVSGRQLRRVVLVHTILSFGYNTTILAEAVNLAIGFLG